MWGWHKNALKGEGQKRWKVLWVMQAETKVKPSSKAVLALNCNWSVLWGYHGFTNFVVPFGLLCLMHLNLKIIVLATVVESKQLHVKYAVLTNFSGI